MREMLGCATALVVLAAIAAGCGGARTRVIDGHEMTFEGEHENARLAVDGVPVRVTYDRVAGAYRAPGCDFGPAATLESLAEQVATTSPGTCEPLDRAAPSDEPVADEPVADEPVAEEPVADAPAADAPAATEAPAAAAPGEPSE